jgi:Protein of unknown function (DUF2975)
MSSFIDKEVPTMRLAHRSLLPILDGLLLITILVAGLAALVSLIDAVTSKSLVDLTVGLSPDGVRGSLPSGVRLDDAQGLVDARTGLGYRLAWWFVGPASGLLVIAGAEVLRAIVATTRAGDPFVAANVRRIRVLAGLTLGYFALTAARPLVAAVIRDDLGVDDPTWALSFAPVVSAVVLLALGQVWQHGVNLRDEQRLTV